MTLPSTNSILNSLLRAFRVPRVAHIREPTIHRRTPTCLPFTRYARLYLVVYSKNFRLLTVVAFVFDVVAVPGTSTYMVHVRTDLVFSTLHLHRH